jgi:hypothetical protein
VVAVSGTDELTAVLLQLSGLTQKLADLEHLEAGHAQQAQAQIASLAAEFETGTDDAWGTRPTGYQPAAQPRWWQQSDDGHQDAVTRLRGWVEQVYRPGYGHLAAGLGECWDQHPLCLYILDWLSELWSALHLTSERTAATLASQAEWHTRLLPAAAAQFAAETRRCHHGPACRAPGRPEYRP